MKCNDGYIIFLLIAVTLICLLGYLHVTDKAAHGHPADCPCKAPHDL